MYSILDSHPRYIFSPLYDLTNKTEIVSIARTFLLFIFIMVQAKNRRNLQQLTHAYKDDVVRRIVIARMQIFMQIIVFHT